MSFQSFRDPSCPSLLSTSAKLSRSKFLLCAGERTDGWLTAACSRSSFCPWRNWPVCLQLWLIWWGRIWLVLVFHSFPPHPLTFLWKLQGQSASTETVSFALGFSRCACTKCRIPSRRAFWESTGSSPTATRKNWSSVFRFLRFSAFSSSCLLSLSTRNVDDESKAQCVRFANDGWEESVFHVPLTLSC